MISLKTLAGAAVAVSLIAGAAYAQDPVAVAQARHDHFKEIGHAMKAAGDETKKPAPSIAVLQASAKTIDSLAAQLPTWFPAGTGPDHAPKSHALPTVWEKPAEFKKDAADFAAAAHRFDVAAASGNVGAATAAMGPLGDACKQCHETFRAREEH